MKLSFIDNIKRKMIEKKKKKQKEKELIKKMEEEEKAIEAELPKDKQPGIKEIIELLNGPDEEELEYQSFLTEEELKEEEKTKKSEKKMAIIAGSIFLGVTILVIIGSNVFYNNFKSDLLKVTQPMMEEYYKKRYGKRVKISSIEELTYHDKENKEVKTGIYLATTNDNKHIISVNNELIGDDIGTKKLNDEIIDYIDSNATYTDLISHSIELSYRDYYQEFNRYLDYINALPYNISTEELLNSKKLTVTYKMIYQYDINFDEYLSIIDNFSDDSVFYLVKHEMGLPVNLTVIKKGSVNSINITSETVKEDGISHLELDRKLNDVSLVDIVFVGDGSMQGLDNHVLTNGLYIKADRQRSNRDEEPMSKYIMLKFNKVYNPKSVVQLSSSYQELNKSDYNDIVFIEAGTQTYIISEEDYVIATKTTKKKGFLCNLGLC